MRDFVSGFVAGVSKGLPVGLEYAERVQERKRKQAEDEATKAWRTSQATETARHHGAIEGTQARNAATAEKRLGIAERAATTAEKRLGIAERAATTSERNATTAEFNATGLQEYRTATIAGKGAENTAKYIKLAKDMGWNPGLEARLETKIKGYKGKTWQEFLNLSAADMGEAPPAAPEAAIPTAPGGIVGYQDGGLVEDNRETVIAKAPAEPLPTTALGSPKTPPGKLRIAKDQSQLGGELTETMRSAKLSKEQRAAHQQALKVGIEAMAEEARTPAPAAGPAPAPAPSPGGALAAGKTDMAGPDQAGQVQSAFKGEPALSTEEWEAALKKVDPEGKLPEYQQEIQVLAESMEYYNQAGMPKEAKQFAKSLLDRSRLIAATYGGAAEAAIQKGEYADAVQMLTEGWNNHVPDGSTLLVSENGMVVLRDADGKIQAEFEPTAENLMAGALGLSNQTAWFEAVARTAGEGLTPAQEAKAAAPKAGKLNSRLNIGKILDGELEPEDDTTVGVVAAAPTDMLTQGLTKAAAPIAGGADVTNIIKPVRETAKSIATELVLASDGQITPQLATDVVAKMVSVDPENPTQSPFQARLNRDKKTKKPTTLDVLVDGEVYSLPHTMLPQVQKLIKWQQGQAQTAADARTATTASKAEQDAIVAADADAIAGWDQTKGDIARGAVDLGKRALNSETVQNLKEIGSRVPERLGGIVSEGITGASQALARGLRPKGEEARIKSLRKVKR